MFTVICIIFGFIYKLDGENMIGYNETMFCSLEGNRDFNLTNILLDGNYSFINNIHLMSLSDGIKRWSLRQTTHVDMGASRFWYILDTDTHHDLYLTMKFLQPSFYIEIRPDIFPALKEFCFGNKSHYGSIYMGSDEICFAAIPWNLTITYSLKSILIYQEWNKSMRIFELHRSYIIERYSTHVPIKRLTKIKFNIDGQGLENIPETTPQLSVQTTICEEKGEKIYGLNDYTSFMGLVFYISNPEICDLIHEPGWYNLKYRSHDMATLYSIPIFPRISKSNKRIDIEFTSNFNHEFANYVEVLEVFKYTLTYLHRIIRMLGYFDVTIRQRIQIKSSSLMTINNCTVYMISLINGTISTYIIPTDRMFRIEQLQGGVNIWMEYGTTDEIYFSRTFLFKAECSKRTLKNKKGLKMESDLYIRIWKRYSSCLL